MVINHTKELTVFIAVSVNYTMFCHYGFTKYLKCELPPLSLTTVIK